jgi:CheY-like chemotaxis protein
VNRRLLILFIAFVGCWLAYLLLSARGIPNQALPRHDPPAEAPESAQAATTNSEPAVYEQVNREPMTELEKIAAARQQRQQFEARTREVRTQLQMARAGAWADFLGTNWQAYQGLRKLAANSPDKKTACTICDGNGTLNFCFLCEHSGKCVTCKGTGRNAFKEPCPTCGGTGKCFLCFGSGRMPCLFCDDGVLYLNLPPPPNQMPLQVTALSRPAIPTYLAASHPSARTPRLTPEAAPEQAAEPPTQKAEPTLTSILSSVYGQLGLAAVFLFAGTLAARKFAPVFGNYLIREANPSHPTPDTSADAVVLADEQTFHEFIAALRQTRQATMHRRAPLGQAVISGPAPGAEEQDIAESTSDAAPTVAPASRIDPDPHPAASVIPESNADCAARQPTVEDFANAFFAHTPNELRILREQLLAISRASQPEARRNLLGGFYLGIESLTENAARGELRSAFRIGCALKNLFRKFIGNPARVGASSLNTAGAALDLLRDVCVAHARPNLDNPPLHLLVVDDDPVSRRAISGALQLAFEKPDCADSGEAALAVAWKKPFDVIFLDFVLSGVDGVTVCSEIRQTELNAATPVVFVTGYCDNETRALCDLHGGSGFIAKPILPAEIALTALTFAVRGRLEHCLAARKLEDAVSGAI